MAYNSHDERGNSPKAVARNIGMKPSAQDDRYAADILGNVKGSDGHNMPRTQGVPQKPKPVGATKTDGDGAA